MRIIVFANSVYTNTLTGGDRIFAESVKQWLKWGHKVQIVTNEAGREFCIQTGLPKSVLTLWPTSWADKCGVFFSMFLKAFTCFFYGLFFNPGDVDAVFASSFFTPDTIPAFLLKLGRANLKITTASYLFSSKKWGIDYSGGRLKGLFFYLNQEIAFALTRKFEASIVTASAFDRDKLIEFERFPGRKILAIRGGVDNQFFVSVPEQPVDYDAVFVGRLHPQKCVNELIEIWGRVVQRRPKSKLVIVGTGAEENNLKFLVKHKNLSTNILFVGSKDGILKAKIIKSALIFVSASRFDSGNIALDEALSCGVPGVIYDLPHLEYPGGVIKVPVKNERLFVEEILSLLSIVRRRKRLADEALAFALKLDWNRKAKQLLNFLTI